MMEEVKDQAHIIVTRADTTSSNSRRLRTILESRSSLLENETRKRSLIFKVRSPRQTEKPPKLRRNLARWRIKPPNLRRKLPKLTKSCIV